MPFAGLELHAIELTKLLCTLRKDLRPGNLPRLNSGLWLLAGLGRCRAAVQLGMIYTKQGDISHRDGGQLPGFSGRRAALGRER